MSVPGEGPSCRNLHIVHAPLAQAGCRQEVANLRTGCLPAYTSQLLGWTHTSQRPAGQHVLNKPINGWARQQASCACMASKFVEHNQYPGWYQRGSLWRRPACKKCTACTCKNKQSLKLGTLQRIDSGLQFAVINCLKHSSYFDIVAAMIPSGDCDDGLQQSLERGLRESMLSASQQQVLQVCLFDSWPQPVQTHSSGCLQCVSCQPCQLYVSDDSR